jgi:hypothetical protein
MEIEERAARKIESEEKQRDELLKVPAYLAQCTGEHSFVVFKFTFVHLTVVVEEDSLTMHVAMFEAT